MAIRRIIFGAFSVFSSVLSTCVLKEDAGSFDQTAIPASLGLLGLQTYYIYAKTDAPQHGVAASVDFKDFKVEGATDVAKETNGVQVALIPTLDFQKLNKNNFCDTSKQVVNVSSDRIIAVTVADASAKTIQQEVTQSGPYVLTLTNCGITSSNKTLRVSGTVRVRNPSGYLSGIEVSSTNVYGIFALLFSALAIGWLILMIIRREVVHSMHLMLGFLVMLRAIEAASRWYGLNECNSVGTYASVTDFADMLSSVVPMLLLSYLLLAIRGWGRIAEPDSWKYGLLINMLQITFGISLFAKNSIFQIRHYRFIESSTVMMSAAPLCLVSLLQGLWIAQALSSKVRQCSRSGHEVPLRFYQRLSVLCVLAVVMSLVCLALELVDKPETDLSKWPFHAVVEYAIPSSSWLIFFSLLLILWRPSPVMNSFEPLSKQDEQEQHVLTQKIQMSGSFDGLEQGDDIFDADDDIVEGKEQGFKEAYMNSRNGSDNEDQRRDVHASTIGVPMEP